MFDNIGGKINSQGGEQALSYTPATTPVSAAGQWQCKKCGCLNPADAVNCRDCGAFR